MRPSPPVATAVNVPDQETDAGIASIDTVNNKLTLDDSGSTVLNVDPKNSAFIVNGKSGALSDLTAGMTVHAVVSLQMDFDGVADRVDHAGGVRAADVEAALIGEVGVLGPGADHVHG